MNEMNIDSLTAVLESAVSVAIILVVLLKFLPNLRVDEFRQSMFSVRDELFDVAASGAIDFSHPAYLLLRQSMNGFIRYGHQLTVFRLACNMIRWKLHHERVFSWAMRWDEALKTIENDSAKQTLIELHDRSLALVTKRLITGSMILLSALFVMVLCSMIRDGWVSVREVARKAAFAIVNRIIDPRFIEEEAARA